MSLFIYKIQFSKGIPSFQMIQQRFIEQTGLDIHLLAQLQVPAFHTSSSVIFNALALDAAKVADLESQYETLKRQRQKNVDAAANWDEKLKIHEQYLADSQRLQHLEGLNHIYDVKLNIPGFYEIYFVVEDNTLLIETDSDEVYAMDSLFKVFYDLGGRWEGATNDVYPHYWKKLKKWNEYRWYNRPKK